MRNLTGGGKQISTKTRGKRKQKKTCHMPHMG